MVKKKTAKTVKKTTHKKKDLPKETCETSNGDKAALTIIFVVLGIALLVAAYYIGFLVGSNGTTIVKTNDANNNLEGKVVITEYSDFECPFCKRFYQQSYQQIKETYGDKVVFEYKQFPLGFHANAQKAAEASECARDQGKFWEMHNKLFEGSALDVNTLKKYAAELNLDTNKFNSCLDNGDKEAVIEADKKEAAERGVRGTPSFWINGELVVGALPFDAFKPKIDAAIAGEKPAAPAPQPEAAPAPTVPKNDKPKVELFVMSYCPYGLQMEKAYIPAVALLGDKIDAEIKFVYYAMHDKKEVDENTIQYCVQKEDNSNFLKYLKCFVETDDTESCLASSGIDKTVIDNCVAEADKEFNIEANYAAKDTWLSGRFPKYDVNAAENKKYEVGGSPTMVINGVKASVQRTPEAVKQAICNAFTNAPKECETVLSNQPTAPGIGPIDAKGLPAAAAAGCGA